MKNMMLTALVAATCLITSTAWAAFDVTSEACFGQVTKAKCQKKAQGPYDECIAAAGISCSGSPSCEKAAKKALDSAVAALPTDCPSGGGAKTQWCMRSGKDLSIKEYKDSDCDCKSVGLVESEVEEAGKKVKRCGCADDPKKIVQNATECPPVLVDCGVCPKVEKGKTCQVWAAYPQACVDATLASAAENLCPADAPEALVDGNKVCQCSSDPSCILKKGDGKTCPWLVAWLKAHWWMLLIGIAALVTGLLFLIGFYRGRKSEVKCATKGCINKATGKPSMGKPGTKCSICGEVFPEPPKPPPAAPGSPAPKADEKGKALASASVDKIVDERVKMSEEVLLLGLIEKLYNACDKGIVALEQELPVLKDPAQMAAKIDPVLVKAITHQVLRELHKQFGLLQQPDVKK